MGKMFSDFMKSAAAQQKVEIIGEKQLWHFSPLFSIAFYIYIYIYSVLDQLALDSVLKTKMIFGNHFS